MKRLWILGLLLAVMVISGCYGQKTSDAGKITATQEAAPQPANNQQTGTQQIEGSQQDTVQQPANDKAANTAENPAGVMEQKTEDVAIKGFAYDPSSITISKGTTVTWKNEDSAPHTFTTTKAPVSIDSGSIGNGDVFSYTFDTPGTYEYHCAIHPSMKGIVIVQ